MFTEQLFFPELLDLRFYLPISKTGLSKITHFMLSETLNDLAVYDHLSRSSIDNMRNSKLNKCLRFMLVRKKQILYLNITCSILSYIKPTQIYQSHFNEQILKSVPRSYFF